MALAIDTKPLAHHYIPQLQRDLDYFAGGRTRRFQIHQVYAYATILHDATTIRRLCTERRLGWATQEALQWQPDPEDDLDEMEVFQHLHYQAKSSPLLVEAVSHASCSHATSFTTGATEVATTPLIASCAIPAPPELRSLSSFHRYCIRWSILSIWGNDLSICASAIPQVVPTAEKRQRTWWPYLELKIDGASRVTGHKPAVIWHLQFDFVDLLSSRSHPCSSPGKRRRSTINSFLRVSSSGVENHAPESKRFNGVRHRPNRRKWTAEMRPHKAKSKIYFGEFRLEEESARAVDAAFYFYGKLDLLNFPDSSLPILSTILVPAGLDEESLKGFVREQARRLAFMGSTLPSIPPAVLSQIPESSSRDCAVDAWGFHEIPSFLSNDDDDNGFFDSQPCMRSYPMATNGFMEPNAITADAGGAVFDEFRSWADYLSLEFSESP